jgi:hydroxyacylglutathione hydrolase
MFFRQIEDDKLAQYSYIAGCQKTGEAVVIDPERDIDRYVEIAEANKLKITAVAETHIHADFLSGARELAERYGAKLYLSKLGGADWQSEWALNSDYDVTLLEDGSTFMVGNIEVKAVHTPGHTPEHMSFLVTDRGAGADEPMGVATGDFVFVNDLGRPDLLESAAGIAGMMEPSARTLYQTTQKFMELPDYLQVWPAHGAGSACGKALGAVPETTWGYEKRFSPAVQAAKQGEQAFVDFILEGQPEPPLYFARMKKLNKIGVPLIGEVPEPPKLTAEQLVELAGKNEVVILDTRSDKDEFLAGFVPGSLYAPLDKTFHTIVGSYFDPETPVYLIAEEAQVDELVRNLIRIGIDNVEGWFDLEVFAAYTELGGKLKSTETIDFDEMTARMAMPGVAVLDVRKASEFANEGRVEGAINIAHTRLWDRLDEVPRDKKLLVHCAAGGRSARAATLLEREGFDTVVVTADFKEWQEGADQELAGAV